MARLFGFLDELEREFGPADDADVAYYVEQFTQAVQARPRRGHAYLVPPWARTTNR
jgi:hypothetical protein